MRPTRSCEDVQPRVFQTELQVLLRLPSSDNVIGAMARVLQKYYKENHPHPQGQRKKNPAFAASSLPICKNGLCLTWGLI